MEVHVLIIEFVFGTQCILTQLQVKTELPGSPQLLHRGTTFSMGIPIYAKSTIARLPFGCYVSTLRSDSIFLAIGLIGRPNYLMLTFLEGEFSCTGRSKLPTWRLFGSMRVHSPNQYLVAAQTWCDAVHWWKVSRVCCKDWWFCEYMHRNVSWRSTRDFAECWFEIPILILNDNESQLLDGKGIKRQSLMKMSGICAHGRSFVPVRKVMEEISVKIRRFFRKSRWSSTYTKSQGLWIIKQSRKQSHFHRVPPTYVCSRILWVVAEVEWLTWLFTDGANVWE